MRYVNVPGKRGGSDRKNPFTFQAMSEDLAYILGVFLGDGYISRVTTGNCVTKSFGLNSVDQDFCSHLSSCFQRVLGSPGSITRNTWMYRQSGGRWSPIYQLRISSFDFCSWIEEETGGKRRIPGTIPTNPCAITKGFVEGFLDSEGYVSKGTYKNGTPRYMIGFCCTEAWSPIMASLIELFGIKFWRLIEETTKTGKTAYRYRGRIQTFLTSSLCFHIARKQERVNEAITRYPSETTRLTSKENSLDDDIVRPSRRLEETGRNDRSGRHMSASNKSADGRPAGRAVAVRLGVL